MAEPLVEARRVDKRYRRGGEWVHALRSVSLTLHPGELVALVGPSGSGKSSLLAMLAGWERPDAGELTWSSALAPPVTLPAWSEVAVVPQALGLLEDLSIRENVALPGRLRFGPTRVAKGPAEELLGVFGLAELADRAPSETSLGQQQRAAVARALVLGPRLVLADEPSAHQDAAWMQDVFTALRQVVHDQDAACLVATHDPDTLPFADRVVQMADGRLDEISR